MKTVNFLEAINSGKRFKCVDNGNIAFDEAFCRFNDAVTFIRELSMFRGFTLKNIINAQFELEEKKITISESEFDSAIFKYIAGRALDDVKEKLDFNK